MSKYRLPRDYKSAEIFHLELSNDEMVYIANRLPFGYSLVLEPKKKIPKHIIQATRGRNSVYHSQDSNSQIANQGKAQPQNNKKNGNSNLQNGNKNNVQKLGPQKTEKNNTSTANNKWIESLNEGMKRAARILTQLKSHKSSWPFLHPVDAQALQIPQYYQIIKEPMDIQTIEAKLKSQKYSDFAQFNTDIMKIIQNSYRFNEANEDYLKITSQFENFYAKLSSDPVENKNTTKSQKKKKKAAVASREFSDSVPVTLMEKKLLAQQIRRLGKEHLKGIKAIVFDHAEEQSQFFDLEKLSQKKLRELQKYVRNKIIAMEERNRSSQIEKTQISNLNMYESDESPFETDSSEDN